MNQISFNPFPALQTERLLLRQLQVSDQNDILLLRSDPRILEYIDIPKAESIEDAHQYIQKMNQGIAEDAWILWGITLAASPQVIGSICLWQMDWEKRKGETGYVLHPDFQGKGIMQEALRAVLDFGFNVLTLNTIEAEVHPQNEKSLRLLKRNHFRYQEERENLLSFVLANAKQA